MPRHKKIVLRVSVFLLLFLLLTTVLSKTIYRLLLPQVNETYPKVTGSLDKSITFRSVVGLRADVTVGEDVQGGLALAEKPPENPEYAVDLSVTFEEIKLMYTQGSSLTAVADMVYYPEGIPVNIERPGYSYDAATDRYIVHMKITSRGKPIETGAPLTFTLTPYIYFPPFLVPLTGVFSELNAGIRQYYVYELEDRKTMWGKGTFLKKIDVTLNDSDYQYAQVSFMGIAPKRIACYPTRPLKDGDAVIVVPQA